MPTIPYDPTKVALETPGLRDTVFLDEHYRHAGLDAICAECARLAYVDFDVEPGNGMTRLASALALIGYGPPMPLTGAGTGTQAFATLMPDGRMLVSFRGTQPDQIKDLLADADARLVPWSLGGRVHEGFARAFESVAAKVGDELLKATSSLAPVFTGHSLGAALATLAASRFESATLVTFGSPRVGDAAFVETLASATVRRYVDCCDFVTTLPPPLPGLFIHCKGDPLYIDSAGDIRNHASDFDKVVDQLAASTVYLEKYAFKAGDVAARAGADHSPINYIRAFT